jgi:hypothetical protein
VLLAEARRALLCHSGKEVKPDDSGPSGRSDLRLGRAFASTFPLPAHFAPADTTPAVIAGEQPAPLSATRGNYCCGTVQLVREEATICHRMWLPPPVRQLGQLVHRHFTQLASPPLNRSYYNTFLKKYKRFWQKT